MSQTDPYEWGISLSHTGQVHRDGMCEQEARDWIAAWESDGGRVGAFELICRPLGEWEVTS